MAFFSGNGFSFELKKRTYIMGILNITEDSFFDGGRYLDPDKAVERAVKLELDGADVIDIGAQSTRPGSVLKSPEQEISALKNVLPKLKGKISVPVSVDTFYPSVARFALENGAVIINDVSGVFNREMASLISEYNAGWVIMHNGTGDSAVTKDYGGKVVEEVGSFFSEMIEKCRAFGISYNQLMLDSGIGFGKTDEDNLELIRNIPLLKRENIAFLTALSCKRVIKNTSLTEGEDLLYGTISANTAAIAGGTDFIRVHHVRENALSSKTADAIFRR